MPTTIVDALRTELGDLNPAKIDTLNTADLDALANAINRFYRTWSPPPLTDDGLRVYSGGWIAGNTSVPLAHKYLLTSLLYAPSVVMHEPLADWFDPDRARVNGLPPVKGRRISVMSSEPDIRRGDGYFRHRAEPERTRAVLAAVIPVLAALEPLLHSGSVVAVPQVAVGAAAADAGSHRSPE